MDPLELEVIRASLRGGYLIADPKCTACNQSICSGPGGDLGCSRCARLRDEYRVEWGRDDLLDEMDQRSLHTAVRITQAATVAAVYYTRDEASAAGVAWDEAPSECTAGSFPASSPPTFHLGSSAACSASAPHPRPRPATR